MLGLNCRIAFDEESLSIIVTGDQILETMDKLEIENLILNVSNQSYELQKKLFK